MEKKLQTKVDILNGATKEGNKTVTQLKAEENIKQKAIQELVESPTEEIKDIVVKQLPEENYNNIIEAEKENFKEYLKTDETFINECKQELKKESEELSKVSAEIENLNVKKGSIEEDIIMLDVKFKAKRKRLSEDFENEKRKYNARIAEMQNTTIEQEQNKSSFWEKIAEKVAKSKFVATFSYIVTQFELGIPRAKMLENVKTFRKHFDEYSNHPEMLKEDMDIFKKNPSLNISVEDVEKSEFEDEQKQRAIELEKDEDEYELW